MRIVTTKAVVAAHFLQKQFAKIESLRRLLHAVHTNSIYIHIHLYPYQHHYLNHFHPSLNPQCIIHKYNRTQWHN